VTPHRWREPPGLSPCDSSLGVFLRETALRHKRGKAHRCKPNLPITPVPDKTAASTEKSSPRS
jgi:hypothetical protein